MAPRSPADAVVALRSLRRRWHGLFAGLTDDERPDDLARRPGADGRSALDLAQHATRTLSLLGRALEQVLVDEQATLHPAVADPAQRTWPPSEHDVDGALAELAHEAEKLADRADRVSAADWARAAPVAGHDADVTALTLLWDAVDSAVDDLRATEATLREVRGRP